MVTRRLSSNVSWIVNGVDVVGACLIVSARALLNDMVKTFGKSGLFLQAFKVNLACIPYQNNPD